MPTISRSTPVQKTRPQIPSGRACNSLIQPAAGPSFPKIWAIQLGFGNVVMVFEGGQINPADQQRLAGKPREGAKVCKTTWG